MTNGIDAVAAAKPQTAIPTAIFRCRTVVKRVLMSANLPGVHDTTRYNTIASKEAWGLHMARRLSSSSAHVFAGRVVAVDDCAVSFVPSMARQSGQQLAAPAYRAVVLVWLLSGLVKGFIVGAPPRTVLPTKHGATTYTTHVAVPRTSCSAAVPASSGADQLAPEEVDEMAFNSEMLTVENGQGGKRLDAFLAARIPQQSRSYFGGLCQLNMVLVAGEPAKKSVKVEEGQEVEVRFAISPELSIEGEDIPLDILYEDDEIIAVSKPPGMVVHPAPGSWNGTFVNALVYHLEKTAGGGMDSAGFQSEVDAPDGEHNRNLRPGIVHRLDKGTTGVLLAAKNPTMQAKLGELFAERRISKSYLAVCVGNPGEGATIDVPIGRHPNHRQRMVAVPSIQPNIRARRAVSVVTMAAFDGKLSVAEVSIETGRTHQIRVHLQHRRTPVLGDDVYGNKDWNRRLQQSTGLTRPLLHAHSLEFKHPTTGELISIVAPLPADIEAVVRRIYPQVEDEHPEWLRATASEEDGARAGGEEDSSARGSGVPEDLHDYHIS